MSFFDDAADWVSDTVSDGGDAIAGGVEDALNAAQDALEDAADAVSDTPVIGGALGSFFGWAGDLVSSIGGVIGSAVKGVAGAVAGAVSGTLRIVGGIFTGNLGSILQGVQDIVSGVAGGILVFAGNVVSLVQTVFTIERRRKLTDEELRLLENVFREGLALSRIRVVVGLVGLFAVNDRPVTVGCIIYMKATKAEDWNAVLVHECVHVWQYQHVGPRYASDALGAQLLLGKDRRGGDVAYAWQRELPKPWEKFNREAQAEAVSDVFLYGGLEGVVPAGDGQFYGADRVPAVGTFVLPPAGLDPPSHLEAGNFTALADELTQALRSA